MLSLLHLQSISHICSTHTPSTTTKDKLDKQAPVEGLFLRQSSSFFCFRCRSGVLCATEPSNHPSAFSRKVLFPDGSKKTLVDPCTKTSVELLQQALAFLVLLSRMDITRQKFCPRARRPWFWVSLPPDPDFPGSQTSSSNRGSWNHSPHVNAPFAARFFPSSSSLPTCVLFDSRLAAASRSSFPSPSLPDRNPLQTSTHLNALDSLHPCLLFAHPPSLHPYLPLHPCLPLHLPFAHPCTLLYNPFISKKKLPLVSMCDSRPHGPETKPVVKLKKWMGRTKASQWHAVHLINKPSHPQKYQDSSWSLLLR